MIVLSRAVLFIVALLALCGPCSAQNCPDRAGGPVDLAPTLKQGVVTYRTGLQVDIDGAPNAYGVDGSFSSVPGVGALDHICSGVNILAVSQGGLRNKYPVLNHAESQLCLQDYRKLRDAGFPPCSSGMCVQFYGVLSTKRACAVNGASNDMRCGIPVRSKDATGASGAYYVSTTSYHRAGSAEEDQSGFPDARYVPYLVYDGSKSSLGGLNVKLGDLALIAWKGRATFAVYGDSGGHLCEASLATHNRLYGKPDADWVNWSSLGVPSGALVIAFPGSGKYLGQFPGKTPEGSALGQAVHDAGVKALAGAGGDSLLPLVGLKSEDAISKD